MAKSFNDILQDMVNKDYKEIVSFAKMSIVDVLPACKAVDNEHDGLFMLMSMLLTGIGADGKLTNLERDFLIDVTGLNNSQISDFIKLYDSRMVELTDKFVDSLTSKEKAAAMMLIICICAVDEHIKREETAIIRRLFD